MVKPWTLSRRQALARSLGAWAAAAAGPALSGPTAETAPARAALRRLLGARAGTIELTLEPAPKAGARPWYAAPTPLSATAATPT